MKFDTPATTNPIDQLKVIGKPTNRIEGPLKTTGTAPWSWIKITLAVLAIITFVIIVMTIAGKS